MRDKVSSRRASLLLSDWSALSLAAFDSARDGALEDGGVGRAAAACASDDEDGLGGK